MAARPTAGPCHAHHHRAFTQDSRNTEDPTKGNIDVDDHGFLGECESGACGTSNSTNKSSQVPGKLQSPIHSTPFVLTVPPVAVVRRIDCLADLVDMGRSVRQRHVSSWDLEWHERAALLCEARAEPASPNLGDCLQRGWWYSGEDRFFSFEVRAVKLLVWRKRDFVYLVWHNAYRAAPCKATAARPIKPSAPGQTTSRTPHPPH